MAKKYATRRMPTHQARAIQMPVPTGCRVSRSRMALTMEVTGWCSAKARTGPGMVPVGTMNLDLIGNRHGQARWLQFLDVPDAEIAHADGTRLSLPLQLDETAPLGEFLVAFERRMDQVEVHIVQPKPFEALVERCHRGFGGFRRL